MGYLELTKRGFQFIRRHPVLLLPETLLFIFTYFLTLGLYRFSGLSEFIKTAFASGQRIDPMVFLQAFAQDYATQIIISLAVFVFVTFILGAGMESIKFRMIKRVLEGKRVNIRDVLEGRAYDFYRIVGMKIIIYLIATGMALALILLASLIFSISDGLVAFAAWISAGIGIALFVILSIGLLYRYPLLFIEEKNAATTIRDSFHYFRRHTKHVMLSWLVYAGMAILFGLASGLASMLFAEIQGLVSGVTMIYLVSFTGAIAAFAVRLVYNVWAGLFLFENYKEKRL